MATLAHPSYDDVRVFQKEARTLAAHGYAVTLYAQAPDRAAPFVEDGVRIVPVGFTTRGGLMKALPALARQLLAEDAAVYHLHNPFTLPLALALKAAGRTVIYDVHEDFTERIPVRMWLPRLVRPPMAVAVGLLERLVGRLVDGVLVTQPEVGRRLGRKALVLENAPVLSGALVDRAEAFAATLAEEDVHPGGAFRVVYAGSISRIRGLPAMVGALQRLNAHVPARLWLIGLMHDEEGLAEAQAHPGWQYVDHVGRLPQHEAFGHILRADAGLALFRDWGGYDRISSNKLYEYMAYGAPFVASAFPRWQQQLEPVGCGFFCEPTDETAVAEALRHLATHPDDARARAERGRRYVRETFNWEREQAKLLALYDRLV